MPPQRNALLKIYLDLLCFKAGICDDVMETAWSTMWNVTDETPVNCERFLAGGGMYLFLKVHVNLIFVILLFIKENIIPISQSNQFLPRQCKERFPEKADLLRNMMGLLGNVAEVINSTLVLIIIVITIIVITIIVTTIIVIAIIVIAIITVVIFILVIT